VRKKQGLQLQSRVRLFLRPQLRDGPPGVGDDELAAATREQAHMGAETERLGGGFGGHFFNACHICAGDGAALDAASASSSQKDGPLTRLARTISRGRPLAAKGGSGGHVLGSIREGSTGRGRGVGLGEHIFHGREGFLILLHVGMTRNARYQHAGYSGGACKA
jgi:hypothetical protein